MGNYFAAPPSVVGLGRNAATSPANELLQQALIACPMDVQGGTKVRNYAAGGRDGTIGGTRTTDYTFSTGTRGRTLSFNTGLAANVDFGNSSFVPSGTAACITVILAYKKRDGTSRAAAAWGVNTSTNLNYCGALIPYNTGTVFWDFGGTGTGARVSVSGLSITDDVWAFTWGPRGQEIWQAHEGGGGVRVGLNAANNNVTNVCQRTASTASLQLGRNDSVGACDNADFGPFWMFPMQLSIPTILAFLADPYYGFRPRPRGQVAALSVAHAGDPSAPLFRHSGSGRTGSRGVI